MDAVRLTLVSLALIIAMPSAPTFAQGTSASPSAPYTTANTPIGALLDDPEAKSILDRHLPDFTANPNIVRARGLTLKSVQQYAPDKFPDAVLAAIDAEFAQLSSKAVVSKAR